MRCMIRAAILGASGYVGGELMRLIASHPAMGVGVAFGASSAGQPVSSVHPHLALAYPDTRFEAWDPARLEAQIEDPAGTIHIMDAMTGATGTTDPCTQGNSIRGIQEEIRTDH